MKKLALTMLVVGTVTGVSIASETSSSEGAPNYNISVNPAGLLFGSLNARIEAFNYADMLGGIVPAIGGSY